MYTSTIHPSLEGRVEGMLVCINVECGFACIERGWEKGCCCTHKGLESHSNTWTGLWLKITPVWRYRDSLNTRQRDPEHERDQGKGTEGERQSAALR